jgi:cytochrome c peroxidase
MDGIWGAANGVTAPQRGDKPDAVANWTRWMVAAAIVTLTLIEPLGASATNLFVRIDQILAGANGDSRVQFVELAAHDAAQTLWGNQPGDVGPDLSTPTTESRLMLTFHDATGLKVGEFKFPHDAPGDAVSDPQPVLVATQGFVDLTGITPDFIMPRLLVPVDGMVCMTGNPANASRVRIHLCLSYGNYVGPAEADNADSLISPPETTPECSGNTNGGPAPALPVTGATPQSLTRFQHNGPDDQFDCFTTGPGNADFQLQAPSPMSNDGQTVSLTAATLAEQGANLFNFETFNGNGRTCETCHTAGDQFGLTPATIAAKFATTPLDPLFVAEHVPALSMLENSCLMRMGRQRGLILENIDGFANPPVFRNSPHLINIALTAPYGLSVAAANLRDFCQGAITQHFPRTLARNTDPNAGPVDFRPATDFELQAMEAFMNSIKFPSDGNLDLDRMINFAVAHGADGTAVQRGRNLFFGTTGQAQCFRCHDGPALSDADDSLHTGMGNITFDTGVANQAANANDGCAGGSGDPTLRLPKEANNTREFNIPPLVGVAKTAPFFHDGSATTLLDAVSFYDTPPFRQSPAGQLLPSPIHDTLQDRIDLVAFLEAISVDPTLPLTVSRDSVVLPVRPLNVTLPSGSSSVRRTVRVTVRNADVPALGVSAAHTIQLTVTNDCPPNTVGTPDFSASTPGAQDSVLVADGQTKTAIVPITIAAGAFTNVNARSPHRCTLSFSANTILIDDVVDPTPDNNTVTMELNVIDKTHAGQSAPPHESVLASVAPVSVTLLTGNLTRTVRPAITNADILPVPEQPGHDITVVATNVDCPTNVLNGNPDFDTHIAGIQNTVTLKGGTVKTGPLPLTIDGTKFTTPNPKSPMRCSVLLTATGPVGNLDPDPSNNTTRLIIDVLDHSDF